MANAHTQHRARAVAQYVSPAATQPRWFGLLVLQSCAFFLNFAAFNAAQSLVGSIPAPPGLAPFEFATLYITFALMCIPAPKLVVSLGPKLAMVLGMDEHGDRTVEHFSWNFAGITGT